MQATESPTTDSSPAAPPPPTSSHPSTIPDPPGGDVLPRWCFLRLLGVIYLIAFVSFGVQVRGLVGHNGILPIESFLELVRERGGPHPYWHFPTLAWLRCDDDALVTMCAGGAVMAVFVILNLAPAAALAFCWALYLSLCVAGQIFMNYQWDILLLETGLLAILFAPWRIRPRLASEPAPSPVALWLLRWLLFRLMFSSGIVKLLVNDKTWWGLTALNYHYETQPLPTWTAWYAHHLPDWFQKLSVVVMFAIEILVPFLMFFPWRLPRRVAFALLVFFQFLILGTGNYTFFNLLTIALCIPILDDGLLRRFVPRGMRSRLESVAPRPRRPFVHRLATFAVAAVVLPASVIEMGRTLFGYERMPEFTHEAMTWIDPFRSVSSYGLFRSMTTRRPEIIIEGSGNGVTWIAYEFKYKPGDVKRRPRFVAPHQPRLDWQMWFAALGSGHSRPVVLNLMDRLLEGSPDVLALLDRNPFPRQPPRYVRAMYYDYHFTDVATRAATGGWWRRDLLGYYARPIQLNAVDR